MRRILGAVVLLVPFAALATTNAPMDTGHHHQGETTTVQAGLIMACEVWRDYEYVHDTGEFVDWVSDPYLKNCQPIGSDGSTDKPPCPPGDIDCECAGADAPSNPMCGGGDPCADGLSSKVNCDNDPPPPPPKKFPKCATCLSNYNKQLKQAAVKKDTCKSLRAWPIAAEHCNKGEVRRPEGGFGVDFGLERYLSSNDGVACLDIGNEAICEVMPEWKECMAGWLNGKSHTTIAEHGGGNTSSGTLNGGFPVGDAVVPMGSVTGQISSADPDYTYDLPAGQGLYDLCSTEQAVGQAAAWNAFKACSAKAPDHTGTGTNAICPATGQQGNGGTN